MLFQDNLRKTLQSPLVKKAVGQAEKTITLANRRDRGISSSSSDGIFSQTIWSRDTALVSLVSNLFPKEMISTLVTLVFNQSEDGSLPIRVGWIDVFWAYVLGFFGLGELTRKSFGEPWFAHSKRAVPARDTVYSIIITCFNVFQSGREGREFVIKIFPRLVRALATEDKFVDPSDQLVKSRGCSDWFDCGKRSGKLASINLLRCQALQAMAVIAKNIGQRGLARECISKAKIVFSSCLKVFWDDSMGCFTASARDKRIDTFANVTACLFLPETERCVRIQNTLEREVRDSSGLLKCYSRPYSWYKISLIRTVGMTGYGNTFLYPYISDLNVLAQVRISSMLKEKASEDFLKRALAHFRVQTELYVKQGTFCEVLDPYSLELARHPLFRKQFKSHTGFTPAAASFLAAYNALCRFDQTSP